VINVPPINVLFKGRKKKPMMKALIGIDVSGSISDDNIEEFLSEIRYLMSDGNAEVEVAFFDTKITDKFELKKLDDMKQIRKASGRGGTSYAELFEYATKEKAKEVIVFTDGWGDQNSIEVPPKWMRVWWICNQEEQAFPFGQVFRIKSR
jgi:predicted metal-dependent peptidase